MEKRARVYLLDTEQPSQLGLHDRLGLITAKSQGWNCIRKWDYIQPKHLYFTLDEDIKDGDWCLMNKEYGDGKNLVLAKVGKLTVCNKELDDMTYSVEHSGKTYSYHPSHLGKRKVVATTNPDLYEKPKMLKRPSDGCPFWLQPNGLYQASDEHGLEALDTSKLTLSVPIIGDNSIEAYIKAYSEGKPITEVLLEYDKVYDINYYTPVGGYECAKIIDYPDKIKLRPDGSVIIAPVVGMLYTRDEVHKILQEAFEHGVSHDHHIPTQVTIWFNKNY